MILSNQNSVEVVDVYKDFRFGFRRTSLVRSMQEYFEGENDKYKIIHALKGINFSVKKGEAYGIVGPNASGKSTLLKIIAGILKPTQGEIEVEGNMVAFLQLGLGFQDELTALENIYLCSAFLGMTIHQTQKRLDKILDFSELKDFLRMKLKYFSTGMKMRLAFSIITQSDTDIMLFDEVLAVGDIYFQKKCLKLFERFKKEGKTMIFVSQDLETIQNMCQRSLLLDKGRQIIEGDVDSVVERYKTLYK